MTMLYIDGFDGQDALTRWDITTASTVTTTPGAAPAYVATALTRFNKGYAVTPANSGVNIGSPNFAEGAYAMVKAVTPSAHVYFGAAVKTAPDAGQTVSSPFLVLAADAATTFHLYLLVNTAGVVQLWRGDGRVLSAPSGVYIPNGTLLASSASGVMNNTWHYVELGATLDGTTGTAVVRVDNTQVINFTGNTKNGGTSANIDTVALLGISKFVPSVVTLLLTPPSIDDLYVCNGLGSANNTFLGDLRIQTLLPNGAGSTTGLSPTGSGTNYLNVNDVPDSIANYNGNTVSGHRDTYAMGDLLGTTGTVLAVQQVTDAFKSDSGPNVGIKAAQKSGATLSYGATTVLTTTLSTTVDLFEANPATSAAYTVSDVNALEAGAEVV